MPAYATGADEARFHWTHPEREWGCFRVTNCADEAVRVESATPGPLVIPEQRCRERGCAVGWPDWPEGRVSEAAP